MSLTYEKKGIVMTIQIMNRFHSNLDMFLGKHEAVKVTKVKIGTANLAFSAKLLQAVLCFVNNNLVV